MYNKSYSRVENAIEQIDVMLHSGYFICRIWLINNVFLRSFKIPQKKAFHNKTTLKPTGTFIYMCDPSNLLSALGKGIESCRRNGCTSYAMHIMSDNPSIED